MTQTTQPQAAVPLPLLFGRLVPIEGRVDRYHLLAWCDVCERLHRHDWAAGADPEKPQRRTARCQSGPYVAAGYLIAPDGPPRRRRAGDS